MSDAGYLGSADVGDMSNDYNVLSYIIAQHINKIATLAAVKVVAVQGGGVAQIGTVDVQPLVNQVDGAGNPTPHAVVYGLPFFRTQGGPNAVITDPVVGDIGAALFFSHDTSKVRATGGQANPGSFRRFDWADGVYLGCWLAAAPTRSVQLGSSGILAVDPALIKLEAPIVETTAVLKAGNGATGTFTSADGKTVVVTNGIVTSITP